MTIVEPVTRTNGHRAPGTESLRNGHIDISQDELVQKIRQMRYQAHQAGQRLPGRPALAQTIGVSTYRVRRALEEIARDEHPTSEFKPRSTRAAHTAVTGAGTAAHAGSGVPPTVGAPGGAIPVHQGILPDPSVRAVPGIPPSPVICPGMRSDGTGGASGRRHRSDTAPSSSAAATGGQGAPAGARGFYLVAAMSLLVSMNTSWRFFEHNLHITDLRERVVMFAVLEVGLLACGWGMRANVRRCGRPGAPRLFAWLLCGIAGYMAWQLSGLAEGIARIALGPALGLVMLHLALGIEIRARHAQATTWARIGRELRERLLSRLGLSDDQRDALARTRDRATRRAARLSLGKIVWFRAARVARALRASNVAHDPTARARMLAELAALRHAADLATLPQPSPWLDSIVKPPHRA